MIFRITKGLFLLLIFSLPFVRPINPLLLGLRVTITDFLFALVFVFWILSLLTKQTKIKFSKFYFFLGFYALALTLSTIFSIIPQQSFYKLLAEFYLIFLAVLTFNLVDNLRFFKKVVLVWLVATFLTFLASFAGFILFYLGYKSTDSNIFLYHFGTLPSGNYPRLQALFVNANMLCNYLNISLMLTFLAGKLKWIKHVWILFLHFGIWFTACLTISPGLGGLFLSLGFWFGSIFYFERKKRSAICLLSLGILAGILFFGSSLISVDTANTNQDFKIPFIEQKVEPSVRVLVWENVINNISYYPFLGKGTGLTVAGVQYVTLSGEPQYLTDAHNVWLNIFGQLGIFGLAAFAALTCFLLKKCRFYLTEVNEKTFSLLALSCAFLGAFLYQSLNGSYEDARHLWVLFGVLAAVGISEFENNET